MSKLKKILTYIPAAVLAVSVVAVPVYAHEGEDDDTAATTSTQTTDSSTANTDSGRRSGRLVTKTEDSPTHVEQENETEHTSGDDHFKARAAEFLAAARKNHKEQSEAARQKVCAVRKQGIENRSSRIVAAAQRHQDRISNVLDKVTAYQKDKNLTITNWDSLLSTANSAKTTSQASIDALKTVKPVLDCNNTTVASDVATFKAAAEQTRDNLDAYKKAVRALLVAAKDAKTTDTTTTGGQQ